MSVSEDELARRTGVPLPLLARWVGLGLVDRGAEGGFSDEAAERVRLLRFLADAGVETADLSRLSEGGGDVLARWAHWFGLPRPVGRTLDEAADEVGMEADLVERVWVAGGLGDEPEVFDDDMEMLRTLAAARHVGISDDMLVQLVRTSADALARVADAEVRLFHFHVHERLRRDGVSGNDLEDRVQAIGDALIEAVEPTVLYWHRKGWRRALRDDMLLHARADLAPDADGHARLSVAVLFADLASFTPLTEPMGDRAAAHVLDRFSHLVRQAAADHRGRVLKQIGDEFMLVFASADDAVECGLRLAERVSREAEFPGIRMGVHVGSALYREGDYVGSSVNVAARVAAAAGRGQFLATNAVRDAAEVDRARWRPLPMTALRGVSEPVEVFEVHPADHLDRLPTDPVCGMQVDPARAEAVTRFSGEEFHFCSRSCLQRFVDQPERFATSPAGGGD